MSRPDFLHAREVEKERSESSHQSRVAGRGVLRAYLLFLWRQLESSLTHLLGEKSNPFYSLGSISILLFAVLFFSGLYLFIYYGISVDMAYESLRTLTEGSVIGRFVRGMHRYAADLMIAFSILHLIKYFIEKKYLPPRRLAWLTGVGLLLFCIFQGLTGYIMPMDSVSRFILDRSGLLFIKSGLFDFSIERTFSAPHLMGKWFLWVVLIVHFVIPLGLLLFLFLHVQRLARVKLLPPRNLSIALVAFLSFFTIAFPIVMTAPANGFQIPYLEHIDWFLLFFTPWIDSERVVLVWTIALVVPALFLAVPWLGKKIKMTPALLDLSKCTGCTLCSIDCPYEAIRMVERTDDSKFKYYAEIETNLCVGCGICIGSCDFGGMGSTEFPAARLQDELVRAIHPGKPLYVICRHKLESMNRLNPNFRKVFSERSILDVPCVGMLGPEMSARMIELGASGLIVAACREGDCRNREGNLHLKNRLLGKRKPSYKKYFGAFSILYTEFNEAEWNLFERPAHEFREHSQMKTESKAYDFLRLRFTGLAGYARYLSGVAVLLFFGFLFYLGAASGRGAIKPDKSIAKIHIGLFYRSEPMTCLKPADMAAKLRKQEQRIRNLIKLDQLSKTARERILKATRENATRLDCSRKKKSVRLRIQRDHKVIVEEVFHPSGIQRDGLVYLLYDLPVEPAQISLLIETAEVGAKGKIGLERKIRISQTVRSGKIYRIESRDASGAMRLVIEKNGSKE